MTKVLILGAGGRIAKHAIDQLIEETDIELTLFLRNAKRLGNIDSNRVSVTDGDVLDHLKLKEAVSGKDIVYANLAGEVDKMAMVIVEVMREADVKRLIFITTLGIYDEVPGAFGEWNKSMISQYLGPYGKAAEIIENSGLDYTIIRPAWLTDYDEIDYETTQKGEPFQGTEVSRKSVAELIVKLIQHPESGIKRSLGVNKPGTDADKPAFIKNS
ncbi:MAG: SDR family oxidoreductase [Sporocytophaga sp.]|nr:SDR family oxidoreductase [Sporocytophaga sp.]